MNWSLHAGSKTERGITTRRGAETALDDKWRPTWFTALYLPLPSPRGPLNYFYALKEKVDFELLTGSKYVILIQTCPPHFLRHCIGSAAYTCLNGYENNVKSIQLFKKIVSAKCFFIKLSFNVSMINTDAYAVTERINSTVKIKRKHLCQCYAYSPRSRFYPKQSPISKMYIHFGDKIDFNFQQKFVPSVLKIKSLVVRHRKGASFTLQHTFSWIFKQIKFFKLYLKSRDDPRQPPPAHFSL